MGLKMELGPPYPWCRRPSKYFLVATGLKKLCCKLFHSFDCVLYTFLPPTPFLNKCFWKMWKKQQLVVQRIFSALSQQGSEGQGHIFTAVKMLHRKYSVDVCAMNCMPERMKKAKETDLFPGLLLMTQYENFRLGRSPHKTLNLAKDLHPN